MSNTDENLLKEEDLMTIISAICPFCKDITMKRKTGGKTCFGTV